MFVSGSVCSEAGQLATMIIKSLSRHLWPQLIMMMLMVVCLCALSLFFTLQVCLCVCPVYTFFSLGVCVCALSILFAL